MGITANYACDLIGCTTPACNDADILADPTGARQRVTIDANVVHKDATGALIVSAMGQHVFCSMAHAITWAEGLTL